MAQILLPISTLLNRGEGVQDVQTTLAAATDTSIQFVNDGSTVMFIDNQDAGVRVATLVARDDGFGRGLGTEDVVLTIPAGQLAFYPFMAAQGFSVGAGGLVTVTLDAIASAFVGIYRMLKVN